MSEKLLEGTKKILEYFKKRGLKGDVYGTHDRNISYSVMKGEISDSSEYEDIGFGVRVIKDGRIGFGYCVPGNEEEGVSRALELSKLSPRVDINLPTKRDLEAVKTYDESIKKASNEAAELTQQVIDGAGSVAEDITPSRGQLNIMFGTKVVGNTEGVFFSEDASMIEGYIAASLPLGDTSVIASEFAHSRKPDIDFYEVGVKGGSKVDSMRDKTSIPTDVPVVLNPSSLSMLLWFGLIRAFNGENVRKGKSFYRDRLGEKVAHDSFNLADDPTQDWGIGSSSFDDEGVVSFPLPFISDGVLKNFMYDLKEASKSETESTGNGVRSSFKTPPGISDRNVIVKGDEISDLCYDRVIKVDGVMGAHTANFASGDFSVVATPAWLVEDGEKRGRLDGCMISGNIPDLLESIEMGDDYKKLHLSLGSTSLNMELPSARIGKVTISGK